MGATPVTGMEADQRPDAGWRQDLEHFLRPDHFPARLDQVLATLARQHAPSRLQWRLACLSLSATYAGVDELIASAEACRHRIALEPI